MERRSQSRTSKLNLCLGAKIVPFRSVIYGCYLDVLLDILDVWDILDVLLGCLCVDVIVNIWMFYKWMLCLDVQMCKTCKMCQMCKMFGCCLFARNEYFTAVTHTHTHIYIYI